MSNSRITLFLLLVGFIAMVIDDQFYVGVTFFILACAAASDEY